MADALIGHTGFVGSNLACQRPFNEFYNSKNIEDIRGRSFDTVICAGAPGSKWYANEHPYEDVSGIIRMMDAVHQIEVKRFVLISTVDVFVVPRGVNEDSTPTIDWLPPYGLNRLELERQVVKWFGDRATIVRLPALFGPGLKKNALYDLMTGHETEKIAPNAVYQWYPVERLAADINWVILRNIQLSHLCSERIVMEYIRRQFFPRVKIGPIRQAPHYDVRSKYHGGFWYSGWEIMAWMEAFIAQGIQQPR
jgi:hypothetical protein